MPVCRPIQQTHQKGIIHRDIKPSNVPITLDQEHPDTLRTFFRLAAAYRDAGKAEKVIPLFEEMLKARKDRLGAEHPATWAATLILASAYRDAAKRDKAIALYEEVLKVRKAKLGAKHPPWAVRFWARRNTPTPSSCCCKAIKA